MKVIKKINNNIAVAIDDEHHEVIIFGKGIGFKDIPYVMKDMSKVERTFYDIDPKYHGLLKEVPANILSLTTQMVDVAKHNLNEELNPNLVFVLADHIHFAIERDRKQINVSLPYSFELEYEYPEITRVAHWMVKIINEKMKVSLAKGEITSITMHIINALKGEEKPQNKKSLESKITIVISTVTKMIEAYFHIQINKKSFHYFRFKNHMKYFVQRKESHEVVTDGCEELFETVKQEYKDTYSCVMQIHEYLEMEFQEKCTNEELLYLMIHINRLYVKEDCNRKGITP